MADESALRQELLNKLTPREREVLRYDCEGQSSEQIARMIFRSESDVNQRLRNIYQKLKLPGPNERNARQRQLQMFCLELPRLGEHFFADPPTSEETPDERPIEDPSPEEIEIFAEDQRALALVQPHALVPRQWEVIEQPLTPAEVRSRPQAPMIAAALLMFILGGIATVAAERLILSSAPVSTITTTSAPLALPGATPRPATNIANPSSVTPIPPQPTRVSVIATPPSVPRTIVVSRRPYLSPVSSGCTVSITDVTDSLRSACELPLLDALQGSHDRTVESWFKTSQSGNSNLLTVTPRENDVPVHVESGQAMDIALVDAKGPGGCGSQAAAGIYVHFQDSDVHIAGPSLGDSKWHYVAVTVAVAGTLVRVQIDGQEPAGYVWEPPSCYPDKPQAQPIHLRTPVNTLPQSARVGVSGWAERGFVGDLEIVVRPIALDSGELRIHYEQGKGAHTS